MHRPEPVLLALLAATAAVPLLAWIWQRPQRGLLLLVALLPFDGLLLVLPAPSAVSAWKEVLVGFTLLAAFQPGRGSGRLREVPGWLTAVGAFGTFALVTASFVAPLQAAVGLKVALFGALTAVIAIRCRFAERERDALVTILAGTGAVVAAFGLVQQALGAARLHEMGYDYNSVIRFTGSFMRSWSTFTSPFPYAFFLMLVVLVTGAVALADPRRIRNRLVLLAMPLYVAGLAVAFVRTAWIGLAVGVAYVVVTRYRSLLVALPAVVGAVAVAAAFGFIGFFDSPSAGARVDRWQAASQAVVAAPWGHGVGSAGAAAAKANALGGAESTFDPRRIGSDQLVFQPDNSYVELLYETGVVGLALFVLALVLLFGRLRQIGRLTAGDPFTVGAAGLVVAAAAAAVGSTFFEIFPLDYLFWAVAAVASLPAASTVAVTVPRQERRLEPLPV